MRWRYDDTTPHVTPEEVLAHRLRRDGLTREHLALPSVLVGTFQRGSHARLVEQTAARPPPLLQIPAAPGRTESGGLESVLVGELTPGGQPVAIARLPVGAPGTALVLEMCIVRGVRTILVCGSAGSLQSSLPLGSTVVVGSAEREDGTSHHYLPAEEVTSADPLATETLVDAARAVGLSPTLGRAWTIDAPFRETVGAIARHQAAGIAVVEMEAAAIFAVARVRGVRAGLIVAISDELFGPWNPGFDSPAYHDALVLAADAILLAATNLADQPDR